MSPIGDGERSVEPRRRGAVSDRAGRGRVGDAAECGGARFQRGLAAHQVIELLLELFLVQQLAAGGAIDLRAQFGDAVFIGELLLGLARDQALEDIVAEREIGRGGDRPAGHDHDGADRDPECHRPEPDLPAGMRDRVAGAGSAGGLGRAWRGSMPARDGARHGCCVRATLMRLRRCPLRH